MRLHLIVMGKKWVMNLIEKKIHLVLLLFALLFLAFFYREGQSKELDEDPSKGKLFILVLYPEVVTIENSNGMDTLLMLINLGNKPISLGRFDPETGSMIDGDYELRVSIDISNAPLRYAQIGDKIAVSNDMPSTNANLISLITLMSRSALWMSLIALPLENIEKPEEGVGKFAFTLSSSVDGKIKPLIELGFSILYKTRKQLDDSRNVQATIDISYSY